MLRHEIASMQPDLKSLTKIKTGNSFLDSSSTTKILRGQNPLDLPIHKPTIRVDVDESPLYFKTPSKSTKLLQTPSKLL